MRANQEMALLCEMKMEMAVVGPDLDWYDEHCKAEEAGGLSSHRRGPLRARAIPNWDN